MKLGDLVTRKGRKTRARIVRVLPEKHHEVGATWSGWVEVAPPLCGFTRWAREDLALVEIRK